MASLPTRGCKDRLDNSDVIRRRGRILSQSKGWRDLDGRDDFLKGSFRTEIHILAIYRPRQELEKSEQRNESRLGHGYLAKSRIPVARRRHAPCQSDSFFGEVQANESKAKRKKRPDGRRQLGRGARRQVARGGDSLTRLARKNRLRANRGGRHGEACFDLRHEAAAGR